MSKRRCLTYIGARWGCEVSNLTLGIDAGAGGALSWVTSDGHLVDTVDMPVIEVRGKRRVSASGVATLMAMRPVTLVVIEGVGAMPGNGTSSMFAFGYSAGILEGVAAGAGIPVEIIPAAQWKRKAGVPADKGAAREMASRLWPGAADKFKRVRDDGRADSSLMARWAATRSGK
jgi:crossover junction endodeoxyribonuclease RuvC